MKKSTLLLILASFFVNAGDVPTDIYVSPDRFDEIPEDVWDRYVDFENTEEAKAAKHIAYNRANNATGRFKCKEIQTKEDSISLEIDASMSGISINYGDNFYDYKQTKINDIHVLIEQFGDNSISMSTTIGTKRNYNKINFSWFYMSNFLIVNTIESSIIPNASIINNRYFTCNKI